MAMVLRPSGRLLVLHTVDWPTYSRLLDVFRHRRSLRLTYDRGALQIISPRLDHESFADLLGRLVVVLTEEFHVPIKAAGSATLRRRRGRRGLEPDRAWWIANEPRVRGKLEIDLRADPPPDLAIEIEITHGLLDRHAIYAALRVPELWCFDGREITFLVLDDRGNYVPQDHSLAFPALERSDLAQFLAPSSLDENARVAQFRQWVRDRLTKA